MSERPEGTPPPAAPVPPGDASQTYVILGFIFAGMAFVCCPTVIGTLVFGLAGVVMGIIAWTKGNRLGLWVIVASVVAIFISLILITLISILAARSGQYPWMHRYPGM